MGLFREQASRLLREKWANPSLLAEELYAMFTSDEPVTIDSPLTVTAPEGSQSPPLTLRNFGDDPAMMQFQHQQLPPFFFPDLPPLPDPGSGGGVGDFIFTNYYGDGSGETFVNPPPGRDPSPGTGTVIGVSSGGGGGGFPGVVVSGGPGASYQVNVYLDGLAKPPTLKAVTQLSIDSAETIPAGTWAVIGSQTVGSGTNYFMQVPVWLEDLT